MPQFVRTVLADTSGQVSPHSGGCRQVSGQLCAGEEKSRTVRMGLKHGCLLGVSQFVLLQLADAEGDKLAKQEAHLVHVANLGKKAVWAVWLSFGFITF